MGVRYDELSKGSSSRSRQKWGRHGYTLDPESTLLKSSSDPVSPFLRTPFSLCSAIFSRYTSAAGLSMTREEE